MANPAKAKLNAAKLKKLGPVPGRPEEIQANIWKKTTEKAKRAIVLSLSKDEDWDTNVSKVGIPHAACYRVNTKRWHGTVYLVAEELAQVKAILTYRHVHDRTTERGERGFDSTMEIG